jgi:hypothetical protein
MRSLGKYDTLAIELLYRGQQELFQREARSVFLKTIGAPEHVAWEVLSGRENNVKCTRARRSST